MSYWTPSGPKKQLSSTPQLIIPTANDQAGGVALVINNGADFGIVNELPSIASVSRSNGVPPNSSCFVPFSKTSTFTGIGTSLFIQPGNAISSSKLTPIPSGILELRALSPTALYTSLVPQCKNNDLTGEMFDISGNANHINQTNPNQFPTYRLSGGQSWIETAGVDEAMITIADFAAIPQPFTVMAGFRPLAFGAIDNTFTSGGTDNVGSISIQVADNTYFIYAGVVFSTTQPVVLNQDVVATAIFNGANSKFAINNGAFTTGNAGGTGIRGFGFGNGPGSGFANMRFYSGIVLPGVPTDAVRARVKTILGSLQGTVL